jgi:hypothetical protein
LLGNSWCPQLGGDEGGVAPATPASPKDGDFVARLDQVGQYSPGGVLDHGSERYPEHEVGSLPSLTKVAFAMGAGPGPMVRIALISKEAGDPGVGSQDDVTTPSTVSSVGFAFGPALAAMERRYPGTAIAGLEMHLDPVDEHGPNPYLTGTILGGAVGAYPIWRLVQSVWTLT